MGGLHQKFNSPVFGILGDESESQRAQYPLIKEYSLNHNIKAERKYPLIQEYSLNHNIKANRNN